MQQKYFGRGDYYNVYIHNLNHEKLPNIEKNNYKNNIIRCFFI